MNIEIKQKDRIKNDIANFTVQAVEQFLIAHPNLTYYAFAFDCNAEYAEVNLCFNTEADFARTLQYYQTGAYAENYQSPEDIRSLKYNTGDWQYQCFATFNVLSEQELHEILNACPDDDYQSWQIFIGKLLELFTISLIDFTKTQVYTQISKTNDFMAYCIDHDEDIEDAIKRLKKLSKG